MKLNLFFIICFPIFNSFGQITEIDWENTIGGDNYDILEGIISTNDGGYLAAGTSKSNISGDKTENHFGISLANDYWILKLDSSGVVVWDNTIGGSKDDYLRAAIETSDGGFLLTGWSNSTASDDKTEENMGGSDIWIIKTNSIGAIEWQNSIGGMYTDYASKIIETADGNFILLGQSNSDIGFDKTQNCKGGDDLWIMKLSNTGEIIWQKTIGGDDDDWANDVNNTADNGFIVAAISKSGISGDKTSACKGNFDYWILKFDESGNIQWQKTIGGSSDDRLYTIIPSTDGGYLAGGYSDSGVSGDKIEASIGTFDFWIVKLNDVGEIIWQNVIGGFQTDCLARVYEDDDGAFMLFGYSFSGIGGDKTTETIGASDYWIVKVDEFGIVIDQKTIGAESDDFLKVSARTIDGGYIFGGHSLSDISGDKSEDVIGGYDFWIVKLVSDTCIVTTEYCNGIDDDCNGIIDDSPVYTTYYFDMDNDEYGDLNNSIEDCSGLIPDGYVIDSSDCNDNDPNINPGAIEELNNIDDDCDLTIDEGFDHITNTTNLISFEVIPTLVVDYVRIKIKLNSSEFQDHVKLQLQHSTGQVVTVCGLIQIDGNFEYSFDMQNQPPGFYFIRLISSDLIITETIVKI